MILKFKERLARLETNSIAIEYIAFDAKRRQHGVKILLFNACS
jgi:hypothetical protein